MVKAQKKRQNSIKNAKNNANKFAYSMPRTMKINVLIYNFTTINFTDTHSTQTALNSNKRNILKT